MKIANNKVVRVSLVIRDGEGRLLESTEDEDKGPLDYLQGTGFLLRAVEAALEGKEAGAEIDIRLSPEEAFGYRDESLKKKVSPLLFGDSEIPWRIGETVLLDKNLLGENEGPEWVVDEIGEDYIGLDGNNPWAGKTLCIRARVVEVRAATGRELWAGRAMPEERGKAGVVSAAGAGPEAAVDGAGQGAGTTVWGDGCGPGCRCWD